MLVRHLITAHLKSFVALIHNESTPAVATSTCKMTEAATSTTPRSAVTASTVGEAPVKAGPSPSDLTVTVELQPQSLAQPTPSQPTSAKIISWQRSRIERLTAKVLHTKCSLTAKFEASAAKERRAWAEERGQLLQRLEETATAAATTVEGLRGQVAALQSQLEQRQHELTAAGAEREELMRRVEQLAAAGERLKEEMATAAAPPPPATVVYDLGQIAQQQQLTTNTSLRVGMDRHHERLAAAHRGMHNPYATAAPPQLRVDLGASDNHFTEESLMREGGMVPVKLGNLPPAASNKGVCLLLRALGLRPMLIRWRRKEPTVYLPAADAEALVGLSGRMWAEPPPSQEGMGGGGSDPLVAVVHIGDSNAKANMRSALAARSLHDDWPRRPMTMSARKYQGNAF